MSQAESHPTSWKSLYRVGGVAALLAAVVFRRYLGAEITLFFGHVQPSTVLGWFTLLQNNRLLGLALLNVFDIVDYALVGLMLLALYAVLRRASPSFMAIALSLGLGGIAAYFASNQAFSMLSLSNQYAAATTGAQRALFEASGQALLAINNWGTGIYTSFFLIAAAGLIISIVMLRSKIFGKVTASVGILASALDLAYCITFAFVPASDVSLISVFIIAAAPFLVIWHFLIGLRLLTLARGVSKAEASELVPVKERESHRG